MNVRSCKDCIRKVLLFTVLYATWQKLAENQHQRWDSFYTQKILIQNLLWPHETWKECGSFAAFGNEIWCMDLAYVDKMTKKNNGVKYLLVRQHLFGRTVNAKGMKRKIPKKLWKPFHPWLQKRKWPKKVWVDKKIELAGVFKKVRAAEGVQVYSTMSETKWAFAECTLRSFKKVLALRGRFWIKVYTQITSIYRYPKL